MRCVLQAVAGAAFAIGGAVSAFGHEVALEGLKIVHPWTREPAAGVTDVPVYMTIRNSGAVTERVLAASSPLARSVRLVGVGGHGDAPGQPVIEIPAGASVTLSATGSHLEIEGLTEPLTGYEMFPLWLTLEKAGRVEVEVMVEEPAEPDAPSPGAATPAHPPEHSGNSGHTHVEQGDKK